MVREEEELVLCVIKSVCAIWMAVVTIKAIVAINVVDEVIDGSGPTIKLV